MPTKKTTKPAASKPSHTVTEQLSEIGKKVERLDGFREGTWTTFRWIGVLLTVLGAASVFQLVGTALDNAVSEAVNSEVESLIGDLESRMTAVDSAAARADEAVGRAEGASSSAVSAASTAQAAVQGALAAATQLSVSGTAGEWIVAYSAAEDRETALAEVDRGIRAGYSPVIYFFDNFFVSAIGTYATREEAGIVRLAVLSTLRGSPTLYDLTVACPYRSYDERGFFQCYLSPTPQPTP